MGRMGSVGYKFENRGENNEKIIKQPVSSGETKLADRTQRDNVRRRPYAYGREKTSGERERKSYLIGTAAGLRALSQPASYEATRSASAGRSRIYLFVVDAFLSPLRSFVRSFWFGSPNLHRHLTAVFADPTRCPPRSNTTLGQSQL